MLLLPGCGSDGDRTNETIDPGPVSTIRATASSTTVPGLPQPVAAWSLRGDGRASVGDLDLDFEGGYVMTASGVALDGLTGKGSTEGPGPLDTTKSLTLTAWVGPSFASYGLSMVVLQEHVGLGMSGHHWMFGTTDAKGGASLQTPWVLSSDWVHLAGVSDREAGVIRFYVDGAPVGEADADEPFAATDPLVIGGGSGNEFWAGAIADVAVYQEALMAEQITELFMSTRPRSVPPLWEPDPASIADGVLNGTWDHPIVAGRDDQLLAELEAESGLSFDEAAVRLGFDGDTWWQGFVLDGDLWMVDGFPGGDRGMFRIDGDRLVMTMWKWVTTYTWRLDGDDLDIAVVEECERASGACSSTNGQIDPFTILIFEHTFRRSGVDASY